MRIGIDLMGSDSSPEILFNGAWQAAHELDSSHVIVIIGTHSAIRKIYSLYEPQKFPQSARIEFHVVSETIAMTDEPVHAISHKTGSSLVVGIRLLKKRYLDAFISAGNTGALIASVTLQLPRLPGIKRPALLAVLPTLTGTVAILDIGGNVSCKANHLVQFAYMGAAYQKCSLNVDRPSVALLNIGIEPKKGTSAVRQAYQELQAISSMNFVGNVEGREVFRGGIDVLVTDGFTGNILLKTSEGISSFIFDYLQDTLREAPSEKLQHAFHELKRYFSYNEYPGAFVCGVEGIVIKCHGNVSTAAMLNSIRSASTLIQNGFIAKLKAQLSEI